MLELFSQATKPEEKLPENSQQDEKLYKTYFPLPMQTNYVIEAFPIPHFAHPDTPKLHTLGMLSISIPTFYTSQILFLFFKLNFCHQTFL